jgi:hypothetical protein
MKLGHATRSSPRSRPRAKQQRRTRRGCHWRGDTLPAHEKTRASVPPQLLPRRRVNRCGPNRRGDASRRNRSRPPEATGGRLAPAISEGQDGKKARSTLVACGRRETRPPTILSRAARRYGQPVAKRTRLSAVAALALVAAAPLAGAGDPRRTDRAPAPAAAAPPAWAVAAADRLATRQQVGQIVVAGFARTARARLHAVCPGPG